MEQLILRATTQDTYDKVNQCLLCGWIVNPAINGGQPLRLDRAVIYHLILYTDDEAAQRVVEEPSQEIYDIQSVNIDDLSDTWYAQGWRIHATYAKTVTLVKYKQPDVVGVEPT